MSLLVLTASDVDVITPHFTPTELMSLMARVFHLISSESQSTQSPTTTTYTPHRTSIPMPQHTALFMPARIAHPSLPGTTIKVVCVPRTPGDTRGLPASTLVMDEATGAVQAVVNARKLTALRNAAGSLLSTTLAGIHSPTSIVAFGAGQQILSHLSLHLRFFPSSLKSCTIINRTLNSRIDALRTALTHQFPHVLFQFLASSTSTTEETHGEKNEKKKNQNNPIRSALRSTSLIICATSSTTPLFPSHWVRTGTHVILVGSYTPAMREVDCALVRRAIGAKPSGSSPQQSKSSSPQQSKSCSTNEPNQPNQPKPTPGPRPRPLLIVDSRTACAIEAGELIDAGVSGDEVVEIGELVRLRLKLRDGVTGEFDFDFDFDFDFGVGEVGEVGGNGGSEVGGSEVGGSEDGSEDGEGPITIFKSVGVGLQDVAIACAVVRKAREMGVGVVVPGYD
ncbi:Ketimine reductase mu-crystallin [Hypsizygus marmoreus]|uniref:Ketimine reductase mu-crystallin n=1 Tax=Hypsizygus marmoreus TaxID=39966 RepID=A0A369JRJ4_HYPMA|nr:Ketimine reductase mu-crystallin [Hypsizygus marmoreus]